MPQWLDGLLVTGSVSGGIYAAARAVAFVAAVFNDDVNKRYVRILRARRDK